MSLDSGQNCPREQMGPHALPAQHLGFEGAWSEEWHEAQDGILQVPASQSPGAPSVMRSPSNSQQLRSVDQFLWVHCSWAVGSCNPVPTPDLPPPPSRACPHTVPSTLPLPPPGAPSHLACVPVLAVA